MEVKDVVFLILSLLWTHSAYEFSVAAILRQFSKLLDIIAVVSMYTQKHLQHHGPYHEVCVMARTAFQIVSCTCRFIDKKLNFHV